MCTSVSHADSLIQVWVGRCHGFRSPVVVVMVGRRPEALRGRVGRRECVGGMLHRHAGAGSLPRDVILRGTSRYHPLVPGIQRGVTVTGRN